MATTDTAFILIKTLSVLMHGRQAPLQEQTVIEAGAEPGPPSSSTDGIALAGAIVALVGCRLRKNAATQETRVVVESADDGATYTIKLGAKTFAYAAAGGDDAAAILAGLQAVVDADADFTAVVDGTDLVITRDASERYDVEVSATATGELSETHEGSEAVLRFWGLPADPVAGDGAWYRLPVEGRGSTQGAIAVSGNWLERVGVAGFERLFVEVVSCDGPCTPLVGPGEMET